MIGDIEEYVDADGKLIDQQPAYKKIPNAKGALQLDEKLVSGWVKQEALGPEVKKVGRYNVNPMLKNMIYEVDFPDIQMKDYAENVIAKNMLSQVD